MSELAVAALPEVELLDEDRVETIAAMLELRRPNRRALESIAVEVAHHYDVLKRAEPFEGVVDCRHRRRQDLHPGGGDRVLRGARRTQLRRRHAWPDDPRQDRRQLHAGPPEEPARGMEVKPVVITSENFDTPAMRARWTTTDRSSCSSSPSSR